MLVKGMILCPQFLKLGGPVVTGTAAADEFRDESQFYTARPYVLNERRQVSKEDSSIENKQGYGVASVLLTPKDLEIVQS